jgi:3-phosphoshikimate 1-carboxyvinyltransferase
MNWHKIAWQKLNKQRQAIQLPASKSISNRLLILRAISEESFQIDNLSKANDTQILEKILTGPRLPKTLHCQDAGTVFRFLSCLCATCENEDFLIQGTPRLLERPMEPLLKALRQLGARISEPQLAETKGLNIKGAKLKSTPLQMKGNVSSQFISGLCLITSKIEGGLVLQLEPPVYSKPYIRMTLQLLEEFGVQCHFEKNYLRIEQQTLSTKNMRVEADWSSACFFYALLILSDEIGSLEINELQENSVQGDSSIVKIAEQFGIQTIFDGNGITLQRLEITNGSKEINLKDYPDLAIPLITVAAFTHPNSIFTGLSHLQHKESNRIMALATNLSKFGIELRNEAGRISFSTKAARPVRKSILIETFNDHRIAMSFSLVAVLGYEIELDNASCVEKSFPDFFMEIGKLGFSQR